MRSTVGRGAIAALLVFSAPAVFAAAPVTVSPGDVVEVAATDARCPTFSWGQVDGADSYELVVYRLGERDEDGPPLVRRSFPGSVHGWTPPLPLCLERGGKYAWSIRASIGNRVTEWSAPSLFQVAPGLSEVEILELLHRTPDRVVAPGTSSGSSPAAFPVMQMSTPAQRSPEVPETFAPDSGSQAFVAYGDSCCDGSGPDSYATELGNASAESDPDVLALVVADKHAAGPNVNFIGFFDREELTSTPRLIGEIESTAGGDVHFTGSASISGWVQVSSSAFFCTAGNLNCPGSVECPAGTKVLGGGINSTANQPIYVWASYASGPLTWSVGLGNTGGDTVAFTVEAICAEVGP